MLYEFIEYEHRLTQNQVLSLFSTKGDLIVCRQGQLWVTEENGDDIFLAAGECHRIKREGKLLIESLHTAQLQYLPTEVASATIRWRKGIARFGQQAAAAIHRAFPHLVGPAAHRSQVARGKSDTGTGCHCA